MKKMTALFMAGVITASLIGCTQSGREKGFEQTTSAKASDSAYIEETLNLKNMEGQEWTYSSDADAWTLSVVTAVAYPEIEDEQGVSVCVPDAYVTGIDTDGDGKEDVTSDDATDSVKGSLVLDYDAEITSSNGQTYTAASAPCILNTGAAGYSEQQNQTASTEYAGEGYINIACGNRGKQSKLTDSSGNTTYTGDAPSCLVDQKNAARFVRYNILLGNLPGSTDYFVSTGGSGGGAHAVMFAVTSDHPDFYPYEAEAGAAGLYLQEDGSYSTEITVDGKKYEVSDGAWGCVAYSPITSLAEADMAQAFEYTLDQDYSYNTDFQKKLASCLSEEYMAYINKKGYTADETKLGFDLNEDGDTKDSVDLTIERDEEKYPETAGYHGTYLNLYLANLQKSLQWYLNNLDYATDWTWFDNSGNALSDEEVASMTTEDKAKAFLEGRYAKGQSGQRGMPGRMRGGQAPEGMTGQRPGGQAPEGMTGQRPGGQAPEGMTGQGPGGQNSEVGTPQAGSIQSSSASTDSNNYTSYEEMLEAYKTDLASLQAGDKYGNNIVDFYNPLNYIGADGTNDPTWCRMVMGAAEGDISMFSSLNLALAMQEAGIGTDLNWQWDGGHVPSEIFGDSLALYVDQMYGEYVDGARKIEKAEAAGQTENGDADTATGTDISSWVDSADIANVSFDLKDAASYRSAGSSKAVPGFDVIDYGQEDYVFGNDEQDARHWNEVLLRIFEDKADELKDLFQTGGNNENQ